MFFGPAGHVHDPAKPTILNFGDTKLLQKYNKIKRHTWNIYVWKCRKRKSCCWKVRRGPPNVYFHVLFNVLYSTLFKLKKQSSDGLSFSSVFDHHTVFVFEVYGFLKTYVVLLRSERLRQPRNLTVGFKTRSHCERVINQVVHWLLMVVGSSLMAQGSCLMAQARVSWLQAKAHEQ